MTPRSVSDETSNRNQASWDSLTHINLIIELEAAFGVSLSPEEALTMTDVATIKRTLRGRGVSW